MKRIYVSKKKERRASIPSEDSPSPRHIPSRLARKSAPFDLASMRIPDASDPDAISHLYQRVKSSHALFHLGLNPDGQEAKPASKCGCSCTKRRRGASRRNSTVKASAGDSAVAAPSAIKRSVTLQTYKVRGNRFSSMYSAMINHPVYKIVSMLFAVGALYVKDINYAAMPKSADFFVLNVLSSVIFFWLAAELILYSVTHHNYCFTFFFWLDLVGTSSILMDIPWILIGIGLPSNIFLIVKGGRMGRAARGASSMRFMKLIKMVRMVKLFRIVQLFRKNKKEEMPEDGEDAFVDNDAVKPSKMGQLLADRVTQKVILGVLLSILIMPIFDVAPVDLGEKTFIALEALESVYSKGHHVIEGEDVSELLASHSELYQDSLDRFTAYNEGIMLLSIGSNVDGEEEVQRVEIEVSNDDLRIEERAEYVTDSGASTAVLDIRNYVYSEAMLNIAMTTFMMGIFALGSFVISADAFVLVYPLEYLVVVLQRLSSIAVEAYDKKQKKLGDVEVDGEDLFSSVMQSMTDIFYAGKREKTMFIDSLETQVLGISAAVEE